MLFVASKEEKNSHGCKVLQIQHGAPVSGHFHVSCVFGWDCWAMPNAEAPLSISISNWLNYMLAWLLQFVFKNAVQYRRIDQADFASHKNVHLFVRVMIGLKA